TVAHADIDESIKDAILVQSIQSSDGREAAIAEGLIWTASRTRDKDWSANLIHRAIRDAWTTDQFVHLLVVLPMSKPLRDRLHEFGEAVEQGYWRRMQAFLPPDTSGEDLEYLVN